MLLQQKLKALLGEKFEENKIPESTNVKISDILNTVASSYNAAGEMMAGEAEELTQEIFMLSGIVTGLEFCHLITLEVEQGVTPRQAVVNALVNLFIKTSGLPDEVINSDEIQGKIEQIRYDLMNELGLAQIQDHSDWTEE